MVNIQNLMMMPSVLKRSETYDGRMASCVRTVVGIGLSSGALMIASPIVNATDAAAVIAALMI